MSTATLRLLALACSLTVTAALAAPAAPAAGPPAPSAVTIAPYVKGLFGYVTSKAGSRCAAGRCRSVPGCAPWVAMGIRCTTWWVTRALAESGQARRTITFRSPVAGVITEKKALQGMRFMPGETLYQVADLSAVWVVADVHEQDIASLRTGAKARVSVGAYPDKVFEGRITAVTFSRSGR